MALRRLLALISALMLLSQTSLARARDIPELIVYSSIEGSGVALVTPGGTAPTLAAQGFVVTVIMLADDVLPVSHYPFQDIWLDDPGDFSFALCQGGSIADRNTDLEGRTTISGALSGGGFTPSGVKVWVAGTPLAGDPLPLQFVSPDMNADLTVDLVDFALLGSAFGSTDPAADFNANGTVDLVDFALFGLYFGEQCP